MTRLICIYDAKGEIAYTQFNEKNSGNSHRYLAAEKDELEAHTNESRKYAMQADVITTNRHEKKKGKFSSFYMGVGQEFYFIFSHMFTGFIEACRINQTYFLGTPPWV